MVTVIRTEREELFFPKGFWYLYTYGVAILFFIMGVFFVFIFIDELLNANYGGDYFFKFSLLLFFFFLTPIFYVFKSDRIYINIFDRYFWIKDKIVPYDDIVYIKYNYGYLKPLKYTIFSTVFYFVLKNGEKIRFFTFFRGTDVKLKEKFLDMGFNVQKCGFKDL